MLLCVAVSGTDSRNVAAMMEDILSIQEIKYDPISIVNLLLDYPVQVVRLRHLQSTYIYYSPTGLCLTNTTININITVNYNIAE